MAAADNGATTAIFIGGAISTVIGAALFATTSDTNAQIVESMKPTPLSQLADELKITPRATSTSSDDDDDENKMSVTTSSASVAGAPRARYALVEGKATCSDELRSRLSGVPCCFSQWQSQADKHSRSNDKWLPIWLSSNNNNMRVLWDKASRLPLERAKDNRHWGTKVLGFFVGYSEFEYILPRNSYMFTLGEVVPIKDGSKLGVRAPTKLSANSQGTIPPFIISTKSPEQWVHDDRRSQFFQKLGGGAFGALGLGLLGWGVQRVQAGKDSL